MATQIAVSWTLDVTSVLRDHAAEHPFLEKLEGGLDVWHYSVAGHRVVGEALAAWLRQQGLVK